MNFFIVFWSLTANEISTNLTIFLYDFVHNCIPSLLATFHKIEILLIYLYYLKNWRTSYPFLANILVSPYLEMNVSKEIGCFWKTFFFLRYTVDQKLMIFKPLLEASVSEDPRISSLSTCKSSTAFQRSVRFTGLLLASLIIILLSDFFFFCCCICEKESSGTHRSILCWWKKKKRLLL